MRRIRSFACRLVVLGLVVFGLTACGSGVQFVRQDMTEYAPKAKDAEIDIRDGGTMHPHVVIGTLTASQEMKASFNGDSTYDKVMADLEKHARKVGADALINVHPVSENGDLEPKVVITATAIRYLTERSTVTSKANRGWTLP